MRIQEKLDKVHFEMGSTTTSILGHCERATVLTDIPMCCIWPVVGETSIAPLLSIATTYWHLVYMLLAICIVIHDDVVEASLELFHVAGVFRQPTICLPA